MSLAQMRRNAAASRTTPAEPTVTAEGRLSVALLRFLTLRDKLLVSMLSSLWMDCRICSISLLPGRSLAAPLFTNRQLQVLLHCDGAVAVDWELLASVDVVAA